MTARQTLPQRLAFNVFGGDEMSPVHLPDLEDGDDVRVVESAHRAGLTLEAPNPLVILSKGRWQELERDLPAKIRVLGQINFAHSTNADQREHLIVAEAAARERWSLLLGGHLGNHACHLPGDEAVRLPPRPQQRFNLASQLVIIAASSGQKLLASFRRKIKRGVIKLADEPVLFRRHQVGPSRFNSRNNHASARLQSRLTVPTETFSASAVSSLLSPAKKRNSITRACRGSNFSNACNASSSATRSALRSNAPLAASDNETCNASPPRFSRSRAATRCRFRCLKRPMARWSGARIWWRH